MPNDVIIFSELFDNLATIMDEDTKESIKNVMLVAGNLDDPDTGVPLVPVLVGDNNASGLDRREVFFKSDVDGSVYSGEEVLRSMTLEEYSAALTLAGTEELKSKEFKPVKNYTGDIVETKTCKYGDHFNLGDFVLFRSSLGVDVKAQLEAITFSDDRSNGRTMSPEFKFVS